MIEWEEGIPYLTAIDKDKIELEQIGLAIIGSTGAIGDRHIEAIKQLTTCRLVGVNARKQAPLEKQAARLRVKAVSYTHLTLPTTPYV